MKIILLPVLALLVAACGGGSDEPKPVVGSDPTPENPAPTIQASCIDPVTLKVQPGARPGYEDNDAEGAFGGDGSGDDGTGDGNGNNGQFYNTRVELRDQHLRLVGSTVTDSRGTVSIDLNGCTEPVEIAFVGAAGAEYYDEATGQRTAFPAGKQMRLRLSTLSGSFSVTPYTEAAVRYLEANGQTSASGSPMDPVKIDEANRLVSEILTDQVPGYLRRDKDGNLSIIPVGRVTIPLNAQSAVEQNTLTNTAAGRRGAAVAGLIESAGTLLADSPGTALIIGDQLANDLSDGLLDLQAPGGPVLAEGESPAYTYETLWRSQSVGAGLTLAQAGDQDLRQQSETTPIADISSSATLYYEVETSPGANRTFATFGGQHARLYSDGRLTIARSMGGNIVDAYASSTDSLNPAEIPVSGGPFVDVKVGSQGNVMALTQNRDRLMHIEALRLFEGDASEVQRSAQEVQAIMDGLSAVRNTVQLDIATLHGADKRVVSFVLSPPSRTVSSGVKSDALYVLNDGSLWGVDIRSPGTPVPVPAPSPGLLSIAYDKFVPPAFDPAYGRGPTAPVGVPFNGPRRLYGLTRDGDVSVWLEGEDAPGVRLDIPGSVISLASESKSNIYALTSAGEVYWVNADQAMAESAGQTIGPRPSLETYNRRFALNHVQRVPIAERICWIARAEAAACNSGHAYQWVEQSVRFQADGANALIQDRAILPTDIGSANRVGQQTGLWRMTGIEESYGVIAGRSFQSQGMNYLFTDGTVASPRTLAGERDFAEPLCDAAGANCVQALRAGEMATALNQVLRAGGPLSQPVRIASTFAADRQAHELAATVRSVGGQSYELTLSVDNNSNPQLPSVTFEIDMLTVNGFTQPAGLNITAIRAGDPLASGGALNEFPYRPQSPDDLVALNRSAGFWQGSLPNSVSNQTSDVRLRLIPQYTADQYGMRICFSFEGQTQSTRSRFGGLFCTIHDNVGTYRGASASLSITEFDTQGDATGESIIDFGQYFPWP